MFDLLFIVSPRVLPIQVVIATRMQSLNLHTEYPHHHLHHHHCAGSGSGGGVGWGRGGGDIHIFNSKLIGMEWKHSHTLLL